MSQQHIRLGSLIALAIVYIGIVVSNSTSILTPISTIFVVLIIPV
jgi:hypothetical protein